VNLVLLVASVVCYGTLIPVIGVYGGAVGTSVGLSLAALLGYREVGRAAPSERAPDPAATLFRNPLGK
jgi:hypothetical protein